MSRIRAAWHIPRMTYERFDLDAMRLRLGDYLSRIGVALSKRGNRHTGHCPGHEDRTPSFALFGARLDLCGCFPCGFTGDIFRTSQWLGRSFSFVEAVRDVAAVLGIWQSGAAHADAPSEKVPNASGIRFNPKGRIGVRPSRLPKEEPPRTIRWPSKIVPSTADDLHALSLSRGLSLTALQFAQDAGVLRFCEAEGTPCYIITDNARRAAEIRRVDRGTFRGGMKAFPLSGVDKAWLPGADALRDAPPETSVLLVEGATDLLTAFHLLSRYRDAMGHRSHDWAPVAALGAGCRRIDPACADLLRGRHVRLVPDADEAGDRMADHWPRLLATEAGCTVDIARLPRGHDLTDCAAELTPDELFA